MFAILVGVSLKSAAILAAAWLLTFLLRGRSAAARHLVWTAAAAAILTLPLLSIALPSWHIAVPQSFAPANLGLVYRVFVTAGEQAAPVRAGAAEIAAASSATHPAPHPVDWRAWITALWAFGAAMLLLQMATAWLRLSRMRAKARTWRDDGDCFAQAYTLGIDGRVELLEGAPGSMPMAAGILRPAIFLPADAVDWTEERRRIVLLHELAHVRRGDVGAHMLARAALALNWWNPLAWLAWREFLKECERAADDLVLAAGARPSDYASHLLEVARSMQSPAGTGAAALAMARRAELEGRLLAILDSRVRRQTVGRLAPIAAALAAVLIAAPLAAVRAQDQSATPPEIDATIRVANSQKNHEILEHAASAYESMQKYDVAQTLLEKALDIRGEVSGTQSAEYAAGLVKLGDLELKRHNVADATEFYTKAVSLGDRPEVAGALIYLGTRAMKTDPAEARNYFERAIAADPKGSAAGSAYTWLAEMRRAQPDGALEAESFYQKAISVEDPKSEAAANTMHLYARFLDQQGRTDESVAMEKQARDITQAAATKFAQQMGGGGGGGDRVAFRACTTMDASGHYVPCPPGSADTEVRLGVSGGGAGIGGGAFRVGGGVSAPALISKTEPEYTEEARAAKYQGTVLLYIEVGPDGKAHNIKVVRGLGLGLDEKAIEAVAKWKFKPGEKEGQPVPIQATIEVNFRLQ